MPDRDPGVAAVLAEALAQAFDGIDLTETDDDAGWWETSTGAEFGARKLWEAKQVILDALTAAGYAVVKVPQGVVVEHGARLSRAYAGSRLFEIRTPREPPNEAP